MALYIAARPADLTVPKLASGNYKVWSELIIEALQGRGVWKYVEGLSTEPTDANQLEI